MNKYYPLYSWLTTNVSFAPRLSFSAVEKTLGSPLPDSARTYRQWWSNDSTHVQGRAWLDAGYKVVGVDLDRETVEFQRP